VGRKYQIVSDQILGEQLANGIEFPLAEILDEFVLDAELAHDVVRFRAPYSVQVLESVLQTLVVGDLASHTASNVNVLHAHTSKLQNGREKNNVKL